MKLTEQYDDVSHIEFKDNRKIVVLRDKKGGNVSYRGNNRDGNEIIVYKIEEGILKDEAGLKCDFGLYTISSDTIRFIELKGSDFDHAIKQIINSIRNVLDRHAINVKRVHGRIVLSRVRTPEINSSDEKILNKLLKGKNGNLIKACGELREIVD